MFDVENNEQEENEEEKKGEQIESQEFVMPRELLVDVKKIHAELLNASGKDKKLKDCRLFMSYTLTPWKGILRWKTSVQRMNFSDLYRYSRSIALMKYLTEFELDGTTLIRQYAGLLTPEIAKQFGCMITPRKGRVQPDEEDHVLTSY